MHLTYTEIFAQYAALRNTYSYILENSRRIKDFFQHRRPRRWIFIGCGSGYNVCESARVSAQLNLGIPANAIAAGDLLVNFDYYAGLLEESVIIAPSRSGGTSEVVAAVQKARGASVPTLAISAKVGSPLAEAAELSLELPWAFDESVCQTRTVTNFYVSNLMLSAIVGENAELLHEIECAIAEGDRFMAAYEGLAREVASAVWDRVVVLADADLEGIAMEAALVFTEISQAPANHHHVLDVRHGPMVLIGENTLVVMAVSPRETELQTNLIRDLRQRRAKVVTISMGSQGNLGSDWEVHPADYQSFAVLGIPFIFIPQAIAYFRALERGIDPDRPGGLEPWIDLGNS